MPLDFESRFEPIDESFESRFEPIEAEPTGAPETKPFESPYDQIKSMSRALGGDASEYSANIVQSFIDADNLNIPPNAAYNMRDVIGVYAGKQGIFRRGGEESSWPDIVKSWGKSLFPMLGQTVGGLEWEYGEADTHPIDSGYGLGVGRAMMPESMRREQDGLQREWRRKIAERGEALYKGSTAALKEVQPKVVDESLKYYVSGAGLSATHMLPLLVAGAITGNPFVTMGLMALDVKGQEYGRFREEGVTPEMASIASTAYALAEAIPEAIPLGVLFKPGARFIPRFVQFMGAEEGQELFTEVLEIAIDKKVVSPDMPWGDAWKRLKDVAITTPISAGAIAGVTHPFVRGNVERDARNIVRAHGVDEDTARAEVQKYINAVATSPENGVLIKQAINVLTDLGMEPTTARVQVEDIVNRVEAAKQLFKEASTTEAPIAEEPAPREGESKADLTDRAMFELSMEGIELEDMTAEVIQAKVESYEQAAIKPTTPVAETATPEAGVQATKGIVGGEGAIFEAVSQQLRDIYPIGTDETKIHAQSALWDSTFKTMAQRAGVSPEELYQRYKPTIEREVEKKVAVNEDGTLNLTNSQKKTLETVRYEVEQGEAGYRLFREFDPAMSYEMTKDMEKVIGIPSTFPDYFKNKGYTKKETLIAIDKALTGKKLGVRQQTIVQDLNSSVRYREAEGWREFRTKEEWKKYRKARMVELGKVAPPLSDEQINEMSAMSDEEFIQYEQSAFHASPHKFDKFTLDHIGAGEGAQAYGWGLYFASNEAVGRWYQENLSRVTLDDVPIIEALDKKIGKETLGKVTLSNISGFVTDMLQKNTGEKERKPLKTLAIEARSIADSYEKRGHPLGYVQAMRHVADVLEGKYGEVKRSARLYKVNLTPEQDEYLDWDKPLSEQSEKVKKAINHIASVVSAHPDFKDYDSFEHLALAALRGEHPRSKSYQPTGQEIYNDLADVLGGSDQAASIYLKSIGIPGIRYLEGASRTKGAGHHNFVIFDAELIQIEAYEQAARGRITFGPEGVNITLLKNADMTTFLHETGHFYLKILGDLGQAENAPADLKADLKTVLDWLKVESVDKLETKHHEKFARGFEKYLADGKAPSEGLKAAFEQFRAWLIEVYKNLKALNVKLTPEVRAVMDRMLATDEEIAAQAAQTAEVKKATAQAARVEKAGLKAETPETIKQRIARTTGVKQTVDLIREDVALNAAWKKAEQSARTAFREGKKEGVTKAKADMENIIQRARVKEAERVEMAEGIKLLKKLKDKSKGKIAVEYQEAIRQILEGIDFKKPTNETLLRLVALHDHIIKNGVPLGISQAELNQLGRLSQVSVRDLSPDALKSLAETVQKLSDIGNLKKKLMDSVAGREQQKALDSLIASTRNLDPLLSGKEEPTRWDIAKSGIASLKMDILHTPRVADDIDGLKDYGGVNATMIKEEMLAEITAKNEGNRRSRVVVENIHAVMLEAGIDEITEDMQIRITIDLMFGQGAKSQAMRLMEEYGLDEVPKLTDLEKRIADFARETAGEKTANIKSVYQLRENLIFPTVKNYSPIKYVDESMNMPVPAMIMQDRHRTRQVEQGFTISRTPGVQQLPRIDFLAVLEESIAAQEWYINVQPMLDKHTALIRTPEYRQAAGHLATNWWKDQVDMVARRGWSATAKGNPLLRMARLNLNQAILGYKLTTILKQPFAVFETVAYTIGRWGPKFSADILTEFGGAWINPKAAMAYVHANPALNLRMAGEIAIEETMESLKGKKGAGATYKKYALSGIRVADVITAAGTQKGFLKILKKHGITGAQAEAEAEFLMNITNGSSEVTIRPHVLARGEGARLWLTFQSFFLNRWGILTHDLIKTGYNGNWERKATALLGLMTMAASGMAEDKMSELLGLLFGGKEDDEGFWKKVFLYLPRQLPAIGGMFEKWGKAEPPAIQVLGKGAKGIVQIGAGKPVAGIENLAESIATLGFGIPGTAQGFDLLDAAVLKDIKEQESKQQRGDGKRR